MPTGLPDWKKMAEVIYTAGPHRILVTDEIGYGIVPVDPFEREYRGRNRPYLLSAGRKIRGSMAGLLRAWNPFKVEKMKM